MVLDVVGFTRLMGLDEEGTLERLKSVFSEVVRPVILGGEGRIVKLLGDGLIAEFSSVVKAVKSAVEIQILMGTLDPALSFEERLQLRIGVNVGDIIIEGSDIYGDGVNLAARLEPIAPVGGICITDSCHEQIRGKVSQTFVDGGEESFKNIERPVKVWRWVADGQITDDHKSTSIIPGAGKSSLAVLPLENMSSKAELSYLADGLTEDITTMLARLPGFLVIARNSSFKYKGTSPDIHQVGQELEVDYVVVGSLRPVGKIVRLTVQLIEVETGSHLWVKTFDKPSDQLEEMQDQITLGIATRLEPELAKAEIKRMRKRGDSNVDAWGYYNQAAGILSLKGWHRETFEEANELLRKAIEKDPDFALAHAYLSLIMALGHMFGLSPDGQDGRRLAIETARQAMTIDNNDSSVLGFAGCALSDVGEVKRGIGVLERAIEADPSNPQAWAAMGTALLRSGKAKKGVEYLQHGMRISPLDNRQSFWGTTLAYALFRLRRYDEAEEEARKACQRDESSYLAKVVMALVYAHGNQTCEARELIDEALRLRPGLRCDDVLAMIGRRGVQLLRDSSLLN